MAALRSWLGLLFVASAILCGQLLLKSGINRIGPVALAPREILAALPAMLRSPRIVAGLAVSTLATLSWLAILSRRDLSAVSPTMTGLYFVLLLLSARLFLGESVSFARWGGALLVLAGLLLIARSE